MFKKVAVILSTLFLAFFILFTSILRASSISYPFKDGAMAQNLTDVVSQNKDGKVSIEYFFPYEGKILPDNSLWYLKALRDRLLFIFTSNTSRKAELMLLFSDKRLISSKKLFEEGKSRIALSTLTKAEKYLEGAANLTELDRKKGTDTTAFEIKLALSSLKHREIIEDLLTKVPEDLKPEVVRVMDYSKNVYKLNRDALLSKGVTPPSNPFDGE